MSVKCSCMLSVTLWISSDFMDLRELWWVPEAVHVAHLYEFGEELRYVDRSARLWSRTRIPSAPVAA